MSIFDTDKDGKISLAELEAGGLDALPNFDDAEGHHYDVESGAFPSLPETWKSVLLAYITEFFLHHEGASDKLRVLGMPQLTFTLEEMHNTPETQTDEAYNHPEDLEHFAHHEAIERKEAEKEAEFMGITVEEALKQHEHDGEPAPPPTPNDQQAPIGDGATPPDPLDAHPYGDAAAKPNVPKYVRPSADQHDPITKFRNAKKDSEAQGEWGQGEAGYKTPNSPAEKMRKNVPYKVRGAVHLPMCFHEMVD